MESLQHPETPQEKLKTELLSGNITPEDFLKEVQNLDQSTPEHDQSLENLELLGNHEVQTKLNNEETIFRYKDLLSLTYFHIAQIEAINETGNELKYFESALLCAEEAGPDLGEYYDEWIFYVKATIAYLKNDTNTLSTCLEKIVSPKNRVIVESFLKGLELRGHADYKADYNN